MPGSIAGLDKQQQSDVATIVNVGRKMGMSGRDIAIAIMTSMDEASLHNLSGGDRDSAGIMQQRPSQGWGSYQQVTNPTYAATQFFTHLKNVSGRDLMQPWQAAQAVQQSGFPDGSNYEQYWNGPANGFQVSAQQIAAHYGVNPSDNSGGAGKGNVVGGSSSGNPPGWVSDIPGVGGFIDAGKGAQSATNAVASGINAIGTFFGYLTWIFNVDNFMKFLLYVFGTIAIGAGLSMITFGAGKDAEGV